MNFQERNRLEKLLKGIRLDDYRGFCAALLSNQIGGAGSSLRVDAGLSIQRQILLELLVHLDSVLLTGNLLLVPLKNIAFQPQTVTVSYMFLGRHRFYSCSYHLTGSFHTPVDLSLKTLCEQFLLNLRSN